MKNNEKPTLIRITTIPGSLRGLLEGQLKYMSQYFNVIGISSPGNYLEEVAQKEEIRVISVPIDRKPNPINDLISIYKLYKIFRKEKPTIVHTHTPKAGMVGMIAAYFAHVPIRLHTVAGLPLMTYNSIMKSILIFMEWLTYKFAHKVYPNSNGLMQYIINLNIISHKKLKVIGNGSSNGIDLNYFNPALVTESQIESIRNQFGIKQTDFVYICIARIVKDKGINELVQAFNALSLKYNNVKLLLLGRFEDNLDPVLPETKEYLQKSEKVVLAGYQNDIRPFLSLADVFVHPSYREGFPNVVMQACAFNKPAIVTDINGSNEIIQNDVNGFVVPVANVAKLQEAMEVLYSNTMLRELFSHKNRQIMEQKFVRTYVWNQILNEYMEWINILNKDLRN